MWSVYFVLNDHVGGDSSMVKCWASDQKDVDQWFDYQTDIASLVLGKDTLRFFSIQAKQLWWPSWTKKLANRTKKVLCVGVVRQTQSAWFLRTNERPHSAYRVIQLCSGRRLVCVSAAFFFSSCFECNFEKIKIHFALTVIAVHVERAFRTFLFKILFCETIVKQLWQFFRIFSHQFWFSSAKKSLDIRNYFPP